MAVGTDEFALGEFRIECLIGATRHLRHLILLVPQMIEIKHCVIGVRNTEMAINTRPALEFGDQEALATLEEVALLVVRLAVGGCLGLVEMRGVIRSTFLTGFSVFHFFFREKELSSFLNFSI